MRITIIQTELEEAVKSYVLGQLNVAEGMDINVSLRAGRGEDGFTADIDIVKSAVKPKVTPTTLPKTEPVTSTQKVEEPAQEATSGEAEASEPEATVEPTEENTAIAAEPETAQTRPAGSLFSGLKRPGN